ncbi:serine/threonine-protein kinase [Corallococcus carmarthensis]|uniref:Serine/threonine protein kinase n=1 Tax=Corallococcus carmarthensis TaxID=2316728 RepID=A0A3A8JXS2_9BACT|nr:serine/threonine-protein kinase [Corallococcus carmarthensis]RKG99756.1 serine/threonine protein kinase [Corallococcus carmarthensis]
MSTSTPGSGGSPRPERRPPPTPDTPRFLFSVEGVRYEAIRELVLMQSGELLMLARRRAEADGTLPGLCFVRRLPNPSTYLRRKRLAEEVQLAFRLNHPGIALVYFLKVHEDALHVVMEYVDGPSLETLVSAGVARGQPVSESFALYVGAELAEALHHAHTLTDDEGKLLGVIHRDVNPRHVFVGAHGGVKLTNFGAAYSLIVGREQSPLRLVRGDVAYASPEYLEKEPLTPRSDVFSLGVLLVELFTGTHLFDVQDVSLAPKGLAPLEIEILPSLPLIQMRILLSSFSPADVEAAVATLSPDVKALLHTALRANPEERFATAADLRDALRAALAKRHPGYGRQEAAAEVARVLAEGSCLRDAVEFGEGGLFPEGLEAHEFEAAPKRK